jgi:integrase/recombinase XerD
MTGPLVLRDRLEEYLSLRRTLGFKLSFSAYELPDFVNFAETAGATHITTELALAWASQPPKDPSHRVARRMEAVRGFARFVSGFDRASEVPPHDLTPLPDRKIRPYLFSDADLAALMAAARQLPDALRAASYDTLIGLLAVTGMRIGEVIGLDRGDVDWEQGLLTIRGAKFNKTRQLPLHPTTMTALGAYADIRSRLCPKPNTPAFFVSRAGTRLLYQNVQFEFMKLAGKAGLQGSHGSRPRPHDLRHSFAVKSLIDWYRKGIDPDRHMAALSTYLGHVNPSDTYWYLHAAPELVTLAAERLNEGGNPT